MMILAGVAIAEAAALVVLGLAVLRMYRDMVGVMRTVSGMPVVVDAGKSRIISPYKKKDGDGD